MDFLVEDGGAVISDCGLYRFSLWRGVQPTLFEGGRDNCLFVMNNPSTADAKEDDPTIRRVKGFAASWGFSKVYVTNTNPYRATDPKAAVLPPESVLETNDSWLRKLARHAQWVIAAWGNDAHWLLEERAISVLRAERSVFALGLTKAQRPNHPLYLRRDVKPFLWQRAAQLSEQSTPLESP